MPEWCKLSPLFLLFFLPSLFLSSQYVGPSLTPRRIWFSFHLHFIFCISFSLLSTIRIFFTHATGSIYRENKPTLTELSYFPAKIWKTKIDIGSMFISHLDCHAVKYSFSLFSFFPREIRCKKKREIDWGYLVVLAAAGRAVKGVTKAPSRSAICGCENSHQEKPAEVSKNWPTILPHDNRHLTEQSPVSHFICLVGLFLFTKILRLISFTYQNSSEKLSIFADYSWKAFTQKIIFNFTGALLFEF